MNLSELDEKTLKAMAYDEIVAIQNAQARLQALNSEIAERMYKNKQQDINEQPEQI